MNKELPESGVVRAKLDYNPATGLFKWRQCAHRWGGKIAGAITGSGYRKIKLLGAHYVDARLAYVWMGEKLKSTDNVHRLDGDLLNCRWSNLCRATQSDCTHTAGLSSHNTSGCTGVYFDRQTQKWKAEIVVNGEWINLGRHDTFVIAVKARKRAEKKLLRFPKIKQ